MVLLVLSIVLIAFGPIFVKLLGLLLLLYVLMGIKIIYEYERGVLFILGRYYGILNPGFVWILPVLQDVQKIDLRVISIDIPPQDVITKDNVPVKVNGVVFFRVEHPEKAVLNVRDYRVATVLYAQTVLRDVIGNVELDELLEKREEIGERIRKIVDEITDQWGVDVTGVRIQDIIIPEDIKRAIARQAEAEREKRAVIIKSEGELKAAENLVKAAKMISSAPEALHLRTLHTLADISSDPNQKVVVLLPVEMLKAFIRDDK
ncbi:MAG TPA: slipin family protein [Candidatus Nanopusillus sp.]|nr:slipin family protein [Candidatus Nanopusillus sp.]